MELIGVLVVVLLVYGVCATFTNSTSTPTVSDSCDIPVVANANVSGEHGQFSSTGETLEIVCHSGFRFPNIKSSVLHVICVEDGRWLDVLRFGSIPSCERIGSCPVPQVENGYVMRKNGGYMPGEEAPIQCRDAYKLSSTQLDSHISCQSDGSWRNVQGTDELPTCQVTGCTVYNFEHGRVKAGAPASESRVPSETSVEFFCDTGYSLSGNKHWAQCMKGRWSITWPQCLSDSDMVGCTMPAGIAHGTYRISDDQLPPQSTVEYVCDQGYNLVGSEIRRCRAGEWSGQLPDCVLEPRGCEKPDKIENGGYTCFEKVNCAGADLIANGSSIYFYCDPGYKMQRGSLRITCEGEYWVGTSHNQPVCEIRKSCDPPMDIPNGNWWIDGIYPDYRFGSRITYECNPGYKSIDGKNSTNLTCRESGYWSDYAPRCLPIDSYCGEPRLLEHGFYMCKPDSCNLYRMGTEIEYACTKGYILSKQRTERIVCGQGGTWQFVPHHLYCVKDTLESEASKDHSAISPVTVVVSTSCSVLGLLVIVMIIFLFQRRKGPLHRCRGGHLHPSCGGGVPPPPAYSEMAPDARLATAVASEHDRTALISFADGTQAVLPSYDEVTHGRYPPRLHRFNSDASRGSRTGSEYRSLPPVSQQLRHSSAVRELSPEHRDQRDQHSINSYPRGDALSVTFGSIDTMNVSDNTSTTVTLGTYESGASNPSLAMSQRATLGSMNSSNPSLGTDEAPLLEANDTVSHRSQTASPSIPEEADEAFPK